MERDSRHEGHPNVGWAVPTNKKMVGLAPPYLWKATKDVRRLKTGY
jgi:hypothetical protein